MKTYYLTFGQESPAKNGWIEVEASCYDEAKKKVESAYGRAWSFIYSEEKFNKDFFPVGKLGELK